MSDAIPLASTPGSSEDWIVLTQAARDKAADYARRENREVVRVTFDATGNLGLELDRLRPGDRTFLQGPVTVAIAATAADLVKGLEIDFETTGGKVGFAFRGKAPALKPEIGLKARALAAAAAEHGGSDHDAEGSHVRSYLNVFYALIVLTAVEILTTYLPVSKTAMVLLLVVLAVTKASLVGAYFMHLRLEGRWKHVLLVPPTILATVLTFALLPDVSFAEHGPAWQNVGQLGALPDEPAPAPEASKR